MRDKEVISRITGDLRVVFDVAMRERCTHRCAVRLGLTELDVRSALLQLDATLGEPLFTMLGTGLTPTEQAVHLAQALRGDTKPPSE